MFASAHQGSAFARRLCLTLAALAIFLKVAVPAGFMPQARSAERLPFALVLCTGQGVVTVDAGHPGGPDQDHGKKPAHDAPCLFAGHGVQAPAPDLFDPVPVEFVAFTAAAPKAPPYDLAPGRGLAAPPLPARGPPQKLI